jgi:YHS domain-containing protein
MKIICYAVIILSVIGIIIIGCAPKQEAPTPIPQPSTTTPEMQTQSQSTTLSSDTEEMVTCAYDKMQMKKSAMEANMKYKGKTLYFCTKDEMEKFKKDPEGYLSGKVKPN